MRILALEPYYGGSHKAFLNGWREHSQHEWTILGLQAHSWKWRMHQAAVTFAEEVQQRRSGGEQWDVVFCSDMLDLATFLGLVPDLHDTPAIAYFHENQLTYPLQNEDCRDYRYGFINMTTALAAQRVWFNSEYHRKAYLNALRALLKRMPDHQPAAAVSTILNRSEIRPQGIHPFPPREHREPGPLRILWASRWEYDKNPETFFQALDIVQRRNVDFRISVIGESFSAIHPVFDEARKRFADHLDRWGYQESREAYTEALMEADVIVSTAQHEFFGVSVIEAAAAGAFPLLPDRLSYPEVFGKEEHPDFFYDGSADALADRLTTLAEHVENPGLWSGDADRAVRRVEQFQWPALAPRLDDALTSVPTTAG